MNYQTIDVRPLSASVGAEIFGVDLAQELSQETFAEIHQAFLDHLVVFFRDQDLTVDQQISFARRFGPLAVDPFIAGPGDRPELMIVAREKHERRAFGENWHSDNSYLEKPPLGSFLYAVEVPPTGGDTLFASQYRAYDTLSPGLQARLEKLRAVHTPHGYHRAIAAGQFDDGAMKLRDDDLMEQTLTSQAIHPVVRTHPQTQRKALYVNRSYTTQFLDWTEAESRPSSTSSSITRSNRNFPAAFAGNPDLWRYGTIAASCILQSTTSMASAGSCTVWLPKVTGRSSEVDGGTHGCA